MIELSQGFGFEAAHTLDREIGRDGSRRIHGHSYRAELVLRGEPDAATGMLVDLGLVDRVITRVRDALDHRMLDDIEALGPGTMENLARFIYGLARPALPALARVAVRRDSLGQCCVYAPDAAGMVGMDLPAGGPGG